MVEAKVRVVEVVVEVANALNGSREEERRCLLVMREKGMQREARGLLL